MPPEPQNRPLSNSDGATGHGDHHDAARPANRTEGIRYTQTRSPYDLAWRCGECGALVDGEDKGLHTAWHEGDVK